VILRLLQDESLDALRRETSRPESVLSDWRDGFSEAGMANLKRRTDALSVRQGYMTGRSFPRP